MRVLWGIGMQSVAIEISVRIPILFFISTLTLFPGTLSTFRLLLPLLLAIFDGGDNDDQQGKVFVASVGRFMTN